VTKGKYAERATRRREDADVTATEEAYKRQIVRLTVERNEARTERDASRAAHRKEVRLLQALNREGTSHRVEALTRELERMRAEATQARKLALGIRDRWTKAGGNVVEHFERAHGLSPIEAVAEAMSLVGKVDDHVPGVDGHSDDELGRHAVIETGKSMISGDPKKIAGVQQARRAKVRAGLNRRGIA
jgi:hypothetical protein